MRKRGERLLSVTKDDLIIQDMRAGGPGGQHQNKVATAIRIVHKASGAVGESRSERSQFANKKLAFRHLIESPKFQAWLKLETARALTGKSIEQVVDEQMQDKYIRTEIVGEDGRWAVTATKWVVKNAE